MSEEQVLGGASGALIVEGIEQANHHVANLPERVVIIRDQEMPTAAVSGGKPDRNRPSKDLSINYVPVPYPNYPTGRVHDQAGRKTVVESAERFRRYVFRFANSVRQNAAEPRGRCA